MTSGRPRRRPRASVDALHRAARQAQRKADEQSAHHSPRLLVCAARPVGAGARTGRGRRSRTSSSSGATTSAWYNISAYNLGVMGYRTPNIDRIAREGALFTDWYGQQSCTAGRASFILGQHPIRTGLLTIGMPGSPQGIPDGRRRSPTCSRRRATSPASSARTTSATATSTCRRSTASTSSSATSTTSTRRRSPRRPTTRRIPNSRRSTARAACCIRGATAGRAEDRGHRPAHQQAHGDGRPGDPRRGARVSSTRRHKDDKPFFVWFNTTRMHMWTHLQAVVEG